MANNYFIKAICIPGKYLAILLFASFIKISQPQCNFKQLKSMVEENDVIPNDLLRCYFNQGELDIYNDFYGENEILINNLTAFKLTTTAQDTFFNCVLIFSGDTLKYSVFYPTEILKDMQTKYKFGEVGWAINKDGCIIIYRYKFNTIDMDTLNQMFSIADCTNLKIDSLYVCNGN